MFYKHLCVILSSNEFLFVLFATNHNIAGTNTGLFVLVRELQGGTLRAPVSGPDQDKIAVIGTIVILDI